MRIERRTLEAADAVAGKGGACGCLLLSVWNVGYILKLGQIGKSLLHKHWRSVRFNSSHINT